MSDYVVEDTFVIGPGLDGNNHEARFFAKEGENGNLIIQFTVGQRWDDHYTLSFDVEKTLAVKKFSVFVARLVAFREQLERGLD